MTTTRKLLVTAAMATALLSLTGCVGPLVQHVRIDDSTVGVLKERVVVLSEEQSKQRKFTVISPIKATSCKNKLWEPAPSNEDATNQLRVMASSLGADALVNVYCEAPQGTSLTTNCWSSVVCHAAAARLADALKR